MIKDLTVNGYKANGEVLEVKDGWDLVITIPFETQRAAEAVFTQLSDLKEVEDDKRRL